MLVAARDKHHGQNEQMQLHFAIASDFSEWWSAVCLAARNMEFIKVTLPVRNRDGTEHICTWQSDSYPDEGRTIRFSIPVKDRRVDSMLPMEVVAYVNGSLESAGHHAALFSRLMDEHCLAALPQKAGKAAELK